MRVNEIDETNVLFVFKRLLLRVYKEPIRNLHQLFPQLFRQLFKSFNNCLLHCFICSGIVSKVSTIYQIFLQNIQNMLYFPTSVSTIGFSTFPFSSTLTEVPLGLSIVKDYTIQDLWDGQQVFFKEKVYNITNVIVDVIVQVDLIIMSLLHDVDVILDVN